MKIYVIAMVQETQQIWSEEDDFFVKKASVGTAFNRWW